MYTIYLPIYPVLCTVTRSSMTLKVIYIKNQNKIVVKLIKVITWSKKCGIQLQASWSIVKSFLEGKYQVPNHGQRYLDTLE